MPPADGVTPLDWPALVAEAKRRRKAEGLTQRAHAELAGVSVPTMVAFDRADTGLSLTKALAILDVVGLVAAPGDRALDAFTANAEERWRALHATISPTFTSAFDTGCWTVSVKLAHRGSEMTVRDLVDLLGQSDLGRMSKWLPFHGHPRSHPVSTKGLVEGRSPDGIPEWWTFSTDGFGHLVRAFEEDHDERLRPGRHVDAGVRIWRAAALIARLRLLATRLGAAPADDRAITIRTTWTRISGRSLVHGSARPMTGSLPATADAVPGTMNLAFMRDDLPTVVHRLVSPLFAAFGHALTPEFVADEIAAMRERWG